MYAPWPQKETKEQEAAEAKTEQETKGTNEEKEPEVRPAPLPPHSARMIRTPRPLPISWPRPKTPVPRLQPCADSR